MSENTGSEGERVVTLRIGAPRRELRRAVLPEARDAVANHGTFALFIVLAVIAPLVVIHGIALWLQHNVQIEYLLVMPILVGLWSVVPILVYRKLVRDKADQILEREGVVICGGCGQDLRRYTWDTTLEPVCPECGRRFSRRGFEALLGVR